MDLVRMGGVKVDKPPAETPTRTIYVCDVHPEEVFEKPGQCFKGTCNGMKLVERKIPPGARLVYVCPDHPEFTSDKPGVHPLDNKPLQFKIVSDSSLVSESWVCPRHPLRTAEAKSTCPDCGSPMKRMEYEKLLAVPFAAVIDTGSRKVVFLEKDHGVFEAVEVTLGPRAGEYYQMLKGLAVGDRVVTASAFLLDAEARVNPAAGAAYFGASGKETKK